MLLTEKGIHAVRRKLASGKYRYHYYAWRGGPKFWTSEQPVSEPAPNDFTEALRTAIGASTKRSLSTDRGTLRALISEYKDSPKFTRLKPITRREYSRALDAVADKFGAKPLRAFRQPKARKVIKSWHWSYEKTPRQGDMYLGMLVTLLNFAVDQGDLDQHCCDGIERMHEADHSKVIWRPDEQALLFAAAKKPARFLIQSAAFTGLRRTDVCKLPATADKGDHLNWWTSKSNSRTEVVIPIIPEYRLILDELKSFRESFETPPITLHCNSRGRPYTPDGLSSCFDDARARVGIDKRFHDLRGTAVHNYIRAGFRDDEIAEVVGWSTTDVRSIRRKYADRASIVRAAIDRLGGTN